MDINIPVTVVIITIIIMKYDTNNDISKEKQMTFDARTARTQKTVLRTMMGCSPTNVKHHTDIYLYHKEA